MNIIHYSIRSFLTNEYYSIIRFASKRLFVATLVQMWQSAIRVQSPRHVPRCTAEQLTRDLVTRV